MIQIIQPIQSQPSILWWSKALWDGNKYFTVGFVIAAFWLLHIIYVQISRLYKKIKLHYTKIVKEDPTAILPNHA
jgi:hypothetical protein